MAELEKIWLILGVVLEERKIEKGAGGRDCGAKRKGEGIGGQCSDT